ncbi:FHA domain-containing protein [Planctomicrobium sp. SH664]|uniref:FHA domain-containing protein n=1 Tax=Planctomicrobium sp. SH664 TaxID=3448125 RepID=UPI003F5BD3C7
MSDKSNLLPEQSPPFAGFRQGIYSTDRQSTDMFPRIAERLADSSPSPDLACVGLRLVPLRKSLKIDPIVLQPGRYTLGSGPQADIQIPSSGVASRHCTLFVKPQHCFIKSWSPLTWLNDGSVTEATIRHGDRLILGPVEFKLEVLRGSSASPAELPADHLADLFATVAARSTTHDQLPPPVRRETEIQQALADVQDLLDEACHHEQPASSGGVHSPTASASAVDSRNAVADRELELAGRCSLLAKLTRNLKGKYRDLASRESTLLQLEQDLHQRDETIRTHLARTTARQRQIDLREAELERRAELLRNENEQLTRLRRTVTIQEQHCGEAMKHFEEKCRSRELFLEDFELKISQRSQELENEQQRLLQQKSELSEAAARLEERHRLLEEREQQFLQSTQEGEQRQAELTAALQALAQQREQLLADQQSWAAQQSAILEDRLQLDQSLTALLATEQHHSQLAADLQARTAAVNEREQIAQRRLCEIASQEQALATRQAELEQAQADLQLQKEQWERSQQNRSHEIEQQVQTLATRESELARRAQELDRREQNLAGEMESREIALAQRSQQMEALCADLDREQNELQSQKEQLAAERTEQFAQQKLRDEALQEREAELERQYQLLRSQRQDFTAAQSQHDAEIAAQRAELELQQSRLAAAQAEWHTLSEQSSSEQNSRAEELVRLSRSLKARESELQRQLQGFESQQREAAAQLQSRHEEFARREQSLEQLQTEIHQARTELQTRSDALTARQEQQAASFEERSEHLARQLLELDAVRAEFAARETSEGQVIRELRQRLAEQTEVVSQCRQEIDRLQQELEAERIRIAAAAAYETTSVAPSLLIEQNAEIHSQRAAIAQDQDTLRLIRAELEQERTELEQSRIKLSQAHEQLQRESSGLQAERQAVQAESLRLSELQRELDGQRIAQQAVPGADATDPEIPALRGAVDLQSSDPEEPQAELSESRQLGERPKSDAAESTAGESPDGASRLRRELAALFGIPEGQAPREDLPSRDDGETPDSVSVVDEVPDADAVAAAEPVVTPTSSRSASVEEAPPSLTDDESVSAYMERLLARTRKQQDDRSLSSTSAAVPLRVEPVVKKPVVASEPVDESSSLSRKARKLNPEEKAALRADLTSFRQLANHSARKAVAKSNAQKKTSGMQIIWAFSLCGWAMTILILSMEYWLATSQRFPGMVCAMLSLVLTLLAGWRYYEVRRLTRDVASGASTSEREIDKSALRTTSLPMPESTVLPENDAEMPPVKNSPLSFM